MKDISNINRRSFVKKTGLVAGGIMVSPNVSFLNSTSVKNKLPRWRGFNFLNFFSPDPTKTRAFDEDYFKWMQDWGFDFVRLPMAYPYYLKFDRSKDITPKKVRKIDRKATDRIENVVYLAHKYGLHVSLNLHRAPGFCVNAGFNEPYNLWNDQEALDDFCYHWKFWAKRFKNVSSQKISFDLLNEPCTRVDMNDQFSKRAAIPGVLYRKLALAASSVIRKENPNHLIIADGNNIGSEVIPEITDLNIGQSCRGYHPGIISHYKAPWVFKSSEKLPTPIWPGQVGDQYLSVAMLEKMYKPWVGLIKNGVGVHCGECGCYNKTPHNVFLAWFEDLLRTLKNYEIGYALWEFNGDFGILNSGRNDLAYEDWYGHKLDRKLLTLLMKY